MTALSGSEPASIYIFGVNSLMILDLVDWACHLGHSLNWTHCLVCSFLTRGLLQKQGTTSSELKKTFGQMGLGFLQVGSQVGSTPGMRVSLGPHSEPAKKREPSEPKGMRSSPLSATCWACCSIGLAWEMSALASARAPVVGVGVTNNSVISLM